MAMLDTLTDEVRETTTVMQSARVLLEGLKNKLDEAIKANDEGDPAKLGQLALELDNAQGELAAAIEANTPAEDQQAR